MLQISSTVPADLAPLLTIFASLLEENKAQLVTVCGLILLDLAFGVLAAVRLKAFDLERIGNFYVTTVLPQLGGWILLNVVGRFAVGGLFGPEVDAIFNPVTANATLLLVVSASSRASARARMNSASNSCRSYPCNAGNNRFSNRIKKRWLNSWCCICKP